MGVQMFQVKLIKQVDVLSTNKPVRSLLHAPNLKSYFFSAITALKLFYYLFLINRRKFPMLHRHHHWRWHQVVIIKKDYYTQNSQRRSQYVFCNYTKYRDTSQRT